MSDNPNDNLQRAEAHAQNESAQIMNILRSDPSKVPQAILKLCREKVILQLQNSRSQNMIQNPLVQRVLELTGQHEYMETILQGLIGTDNGLKLVEFLATSHASLRRFLRDELTQLLEGRTEDQRDQFVVVFVDVMRSLANLMRSSYEVVRMGELINETLEFVQMSIRADGFDNALSNIRKYKLKLDVRTETKAAQDKMKKNYETSPNTVAARGATFELLGEAVNPILPGSEEENLLLQLNRQNEGDIYDYLDSGEGVITTHVVKKVNMMGVQAPLTLTQILDLEKRFPGKVMRIKWVDPVSKPMPNGFILTTDEKVIPVDFDAANHILRLHIDQIHKSR